jgi:hypothetical protein
LLIVLVLDILVGVGAPEPLDELPLRDVFLRGLDQPGQEGLELLV